MAKTVSIKPEEQFAVQFADRLILEQLTEMEAVVKLGELADRLSSVGLGLAAVKSLLASDPDRFAYHERKWIPASRLQGQGRPIAEAMALVVHWFGGPMPIDLLAIEIGRIRHQPTEAVFEIVRRFAKNDKPFVLTNDGRVSLTSWGLVAHDEPLARALDLNKISREEFDEANAKFAGFDFRARDAVSKALALAAPIRLKTLGAVFYNGLNGTDSRSVLMYDAKEFHAQVLEVPGYIFAADGAMHREEDAKKWISTAVRVADRLAPTIEVEDAAPIEVKKEDIDKLVAKILGRDHSTTVSKLLEEQYEITPSNRTFPDDVANVMAALATSDKVQWVGGDRYRKAGDYPEMIMEVPEPFHFVESGVLGEDGDPVDQELTDEGLSQTLRKLLQHPLALDVLDEEIQPAPKSTPESARLVLRAIHRELGTFPLAQIPTGWLSAEPAIQELILIDPTGREQQVWMNTEARLIFNLIDWWYEQPIENGAVFTVTKTNRPNVLEFEWLDQPDPVVYISSQRMEELRQIGAEAEGKSTLDLLIQTMAHWPKGADYLTLLAEVNVVRRSSRRLIASLLSSYQCFFQRSGSPVWHFDPKKVEQGFDKTKKKFAKK